MLYVFFLGVEISGCKTVVLGGDDGGGGLKGGWVGGVILTDFGIFSSTDLDELFDVGYFGWHFCFSFPFI